MFKICLGILFIGLGVLFFNFYLLADSNDTSFISVITYLILTIICLAIGITLLFGSGIKSKNDMNTKEATSISASVTDSSSSSENSSPKNSKPSRNKPQKYKLEGNAIGYYKTNLGLSIVSVFETEQGNYEYSSFLDVYKGKHLLIMNDNGTPDDTSDDKISSVGTYYYD